MSITKSHLQTVGIIYLVIVISAAVCAALTLGVASWLPSTPVVAAVEEVSSLSESFGVYGTYAANAIQRVMNTTEDDKYCPKKPSEKKKSKLVVFLLAFFTGSWGVDRFYTGYTAQGVFKILTLGGLGIWNLVDWALVLANKRHMKNGCPFYQDM